MPAAMASWLARNSHAWASGWRTSRSSRWTVTDRGRLPPMALERTITSGMTPLCWTAQKAPVRPTPVSVSSTISGRTRVGGGGVPDAPHPVVGGRDHSAVAPDGFKEDPCGFRQPGLGGVEGELRPEGARFTAARTVGVGRTDVALRGGKTSPADAGCVSGRLTRDRGHPLLAASKGEDLGAAGRGPDKLERGLDRVGTGRSAEPHACVVGEFGWQCAEQLDDEGVSDGRGEVVGVQRGARVEAPADRLQDHGVVVPEGQRAAARGAVQVTAAVRALDGQATRPYRHDGKGPRVSPRRRLTHRVPPQNPLVPVAHRLTARNVPVHAPRQLTPRGIPAPLTGRLTTRGVPAHLTHPLTTRDVPAHLTHPLTPRDVPAHLTHPLTPRDVPAHLTHPLTPRGAPAPATRSLTSRGKPAPATRQLTTRGNPELTTRHPTARRIPEPVARRLATRPVRNVPASTPANSRSGTSPPPSPSRISSPPEVPQPTSRAGSHPGPSPTPAPPTEPTERSHSARPPTPPRGCPQAPHPSPIPQNTLPRSHHRGHTSDFTGRAHPRRPTSPIRRHTHSRRHRPRLTHSHPSPPLPPPTGELRPRIATGAVATAVVAKSNVATGAEARVSTADPHRYQHRTPQRVTGWLKILAVAKPLPFRGKSPTASA